MIFLVVLFMTQVISFYFIALLYMKLSKFDDLEKKQSKLMNEMDDALAVYLAEVKDENEQLIKKITAKVAMEQQQESIKPEKAPANQPDTSEVKEQAPVSVIVPQNTMRHHARQSYEAVKQKTVQPEVELDDRTRAIQMSGEGYSIEEIAKKLGKGKTEIELILKFK